MSAEEGSGIIYCVSYLGVEFPLYSFSCELWMEGVCFDGIILVGR